MGAKGNHLGEFEELILVSVASLVDDAYGVSVMKYIHEQTGRNVNISAVHEGLKRLQNKGLVESSMGGATNERGGRRKRFFTITNLGKNTLEEVMSLRMQMYQKIPNLNLKLI